MAYQPIENYGIIGDLHSAALVGMDGSIDWLCLPRFDSPSVFAAILDDEKGGRFKIAPVSDGVTRKQLYWPDTNVLMAGHQRPDQPLLHARRGSGDHGLHADTRLQERPWTPPGDSQDQGGPRRDELPNGMFSCFQLFP
jgi:hypothetical protein